jgi:hypothetical protein
MISLPKELKDFAMWLNPSNLRAFNKMEVMQLGLKVSRQKAPKPSLPDIHKLGAGLGIDQRSFGIFVLRIYFYQIFKNEMISLDLRRSRFSHSGAWTFLGENLGHQFSPVFIKALQDTYKSYYLNDGQGLSDCLERLGLFSPSWDNSLKSKLTDLFLAHFQSGAQVPKLFKLTDMIDSFGQIFFFIKEHGGKVPSEFALLGLYLTSLYLTLEETKQAFNVRDTFMAVHG